MVTRISRRAAAAALAFSVLTFILATTATPASASARWIGSGQRLASGQHLVAGSYSLDMQTDGNLVEYGPAGTLWASQTAGQPGNYLVMQADGNLVVDAPDGQVRWQSGTGGYPGARLAMQANGNVTVRSSAGRLLWARSWTRSLGGAQAYARVRFAHYGWDVATQYPYLNDLWNAESGWHWDICSGGGRYPDCDDGGSAYGIPQSDPGSKMATSNPDWATDGLTQVAWGLAYIAAAYGTPGNAWNRDVACGYCGYGPRS